MIDSQPMKVKIIRSSRRKKTISAKEVGEMIYLYLPTGLSREQESGYVQWAKKKTEVRQRKDMLKAQNADQELSKLADKFNKKYFKGELTWEKICYSTQQNSRMFGVCNISQKKIRISDRLITMPKFVHDYVVIHELAHLKMLKHNKEFWELVNQYPKAERARGYLMAVGMGNGYDLD